MRPALWRRTLLVAVLLRRCRPFLSCCSASTAVLLHRCRPFLSCCSASSSATAPK
ncbi:hypothetical protein PR003_g2753 [Phytophthora rubi]|uniref:RxLR effector protein n=1 Tax=Phytophthora rubi TaxID=129364 RepID=A0A6A3PDR7_9STRA|nr:hypothetical protein PR001_g2217 [Phytophthora rubi]KAE9355629.1 hypothetical protein PR003_g2753 [Phytophthora rubi]